jgi:hypothetical protein
MRAGGILDNECALRFWHWPICTHFFQGQLVGAPPPALDTAWAGLARQFWQRGFLALFQLEGFLSSSSTHLGASLSDPCIHFTPSWFPQTGALHFALSVGARSGFGAEWTPSFLPASTMDHYSIFLLSFLNCQLRVCTIFLPPSTGIEWTTQLACPLCLC